MVLLTSASLMIHTMINLRSLALGFDPRQVVTMEIALTGRRYVHDAPKRGMSMREVQPAVAVFQDRLLRALSEQSEIQSAALGSAVPLGPGYVPGRPFQISGMPVSPDHSVHVKCVTDGYFETLGIPIQQGRSIGERDRPGTPWAAVVNQAFVRRYLNHAENAIGQTITFLADAQERPREIVGVVADHRSLGRREPQPEIYTSYAQQPQIIPGNHQGMRLRPQLLIRTRSAPEVVRRTVQATVNSIDASLPVFNAGALVQHIDEGRAPEQFLLMLLGLMAGLALLLAAVGIGVLMHHTVTDRTREIGIRMAFGARPADIVQLVLRTGLTLAVSGLALGLIGVAAANRLIEGFLFGVTKSDPGALIGSSLLLLVVAACSCCGPALRASGVDPFTCLRRE